MYLSDIKDYISSLAVLTTILQFLSGVLVCKTYVVNRTTAESSSLPFICGVVSSCLWFLYGLKKHDNKIILVNIIGVTLMISYTIVYYIFTFKKSTVLKQVFVTIVFLIFMFGYVSVEEDNTLLLSRLGSVITGALQEDSGYPQHQDHCGQATPPAKVRGTIRTSGLTACSLTLLTIAAPMSKLLYVLRVKSTECLPFPMILMSFIVSLLWFMYGIIEDDPYLEFPNFIGATLAVFQLSLFVIYPSKPQSPILSKSLLA